MVCFFFAKKNIQNFCLKTYLANGAHSDASVEIANL